METTVQAVEYPFIGFGINWLIERVLADRNGTTLLRPTCVWVDESPSLNAAERDLVFWWHNAFQRYGDRIQRARINLLQRSKEAALFDPVELQNQGVIGCGLPSDDTRAWRFKVSRVGIDTAGRFALAHFLVQADGNCWLNYGYTLVMSWDIDDNIHLVQSHGTVGPGK
jgi:hypothetical protein